MRDISVVAPLVDAIVVEFSLAFELPVFLRNSVVMMLVLSCPTFSLGSTVDWEVRQW